MRKILIPADFSANSKNAIRYADSLFKETSCHFFLLYVNVNGSNYIEKPVYDLGTNILVEREPISVALKLEYLNIGNISSTPTYKFYCTKMTTPILLLQCFQTDMNEKFVGKREIEDKFFIYLPNESYFNSYKVHKSSTREVIFSKYSTLIDLSMEGSNPIQVTK